VSKLVNEQWSEIIEDGVQDMQRYGLIKPAAAARG